MKKRIQKIFKNFTGVLDSIVIKNASLPYIDENFFYVTGLEHGVFEGALVILYPDGHADLISPQLEQESAQKTTAQLHIYQNQHEKEQLVKHMTKPLKKIGLNFQGITHQDFSHLKKICPRAQFSDISQALMQTRLIKDEQEIASIQQACRIADIVMQKIPDVIHEGMKEYEIAAEIDYLMGKNGAQKPAFETISSVGKHTAEPHYTHGNTPVKKGEFILLDFGARWNGYNSDMTRTFILGKATQKQQAMHATVLAAQKIGIETIKSGITGNAVHDTVASYIDHTEFKGCFIHSTGHSLGRAVHDGPGLNPDSDILLQKNMVMTIEPGIYLPALGGVRIEDDIRIKKDGVEMLTKSPRELIEL